MPRNGTNLRPGDFFLGFSLISHCVKLFLNVSKMKREIFQLNIVFILIDNLVSKTPQGFPNLKYLLIAGLLLSTPYNYIFYLLSINCVNGNDFL